MLASSSRTMRAVAVLANTSRVHLTCTNSIRNNVRGTSSQPAALTRQAVTKEERALRRAARKESANAVLTSTGAAEAGAAEAQGESVLAAGAGASSGGSGPMFDVTRLGWYAAVLLPTAFIGWGIYDEDSPPAKLSRAIGLTDQIEEYAKPSRTKLLPDWEQVCISQLFWCRCFWSFL